MEEQNVVQQSQVELLKKNRRHKRRIRLFGGAAAVVIFITTYLLILPAITMEKATICGMDVHTHSEVCYTTETIQICGMQEAEGHTHSDSCYATSAVLVCELAEDENHTHTDDCYTYDQVLVCGLAESEGHTHSDACFQTNTILTCNRPEHVHTDACYAPAEEEPAEEPEESEEEDEGSVYGDTSADLETPADWEATLKDVELTGKWSEDVLKIADTQLGYHESTVNTMTYTDPFTHERVTKGYSRYGAWYGSPYGDWCAMFCSFCLNYAKVPQDEIPQHSGCPAWITLLDKRDQYRTAASGYMPNPGDLIFYDWENNNDCDHVGLVYELQTRENGQIFVKTIEGNISDQVQYSGYMLDDPRILGYGVLPENPDYVDPNAEEEHVLRFEGEDFCVEARYTDEASIPENAELMAEEIPADSEEYQTYFDQMVENLEPGENVDFCRFFDISILVDGEKIEPLAPVTVSITYLPEEELESSDVGAIHFAEDGTEMLDTENKEEEDGYNTVSFVQSSFSVSGIYGISLLADEPNGTYYKTVNTITSGKDYLIVSVEGNYALGYANNAFQTTALKLYPVKGNPGVYQIADTSTSMNWRFPNANGSSSATTTVRMGTANNNRVRLYGGTLAISTSDNATYTNLTVTYNATTNAWTIANSSGYYLYQNDNAFTSSNRVGTNGADVYPRNMLILEQTSAPPVPSDPSGSSDSPSGEGENELQPHYSPYINPSDAKTQQTEISGVSGTAYSDAATSKIEQQIQGLPADDGKVVADKSVVYAGDDYGAFASYDENTFGITLSALGQQYALTEQDVVQTPIDVVFVLDVSGSMGNATATGETRRTALVNAVNSAMAQIFKQHPENRAGVVVYSSGAWDLLEVGRYTPGNNNQYLTLSGNNVYTATNLRVEGGGTVARRTDSLQGNGTYTQAGIAKGAAMFERVSNVTYTTTVGTGDSERTYTVERQPVIILLSDGDPTHCTSNYMDVLSGPHYGSGSYPGAENNRGIQGYYTILSANYYKSMVGIHYNQPALFFTVGMGIYESGIQDMSGRSATGDHYKRAVLNPSAASILALTNTRAQNYATTSHQLRDLLSSSYTEQYVSVGSTSNHTNLGLTNKNVPVIANPYGNYSYADSAYFGNITQTELEQIFSDIIAHSLKTKNYGFILEERSSLEFTDAIGVGMEVKGVPVLRYNGTNYSCTSQNTAGNVTTYTYNHTARATDGSKRSANLGRILVTVTTDADGNQTVRMVVPDDVLPVYSPCRRTDQNWYYEALPVRLIYQVGLTAAAQEEIANLPPDTSRTYLTNRYDSDSQTVGAYATIYPKDDNPYYKQDGGAYTEGTEYKTVNVTETAEYSVDRASAADGRHKYRYLGNNGRLTFTTAPGTSVHVEKVWSDGYDMHTEDSVTVQLLQNGLAYGDPVTLSSANGWAYDFEGLPANDADEVPYQYSIEEVAVDGYLTEIEIRESEDYGFFYVINNTKIELTSIQVEKKWVDAYGNPIVYTGGSIQFDLYQRAEPDGDAAESIEPNQAGVKYGTYELSMANDWKVEISDLPTKVEDEDGNVVRYTYYVAEIDVPENYIVSYENNDGIQTGVITIRNERIDIGYELPNTGGVGTNWFTMGGILMIGMSLLIGIMLRRKGERRNRQAS